MPIHNTLCLMTQCLIVKGELWLAEKNAKMLWEWQLETKWKIPSTSLPGLDLFYAAALLLKTFSCFLFLSQWGYLTRQKSLSWFSKRPSENYGVKQSQGQSLIGLKVTHLISMTIETQIPCRTPAGRTVTFEELDLEMSPDNMMKKGEEKKKSAVCRVRRQEPLIFIW